MVKCRLATTADHAAINAFHCTTRGIDRSLAAFQWEFTQSPFGETLYVVAEHEGKIIGSYAGIPHETIDAGGRTMLTLKSEDILVDPAWRGKGVMDEMLRELTFQADRLEAKAIWLFSKAVKPHTKLGFEHPFDHQQSLMVFDQTKASKHLISLNPDNTLMSKLKVRVLCMLAKRTFHPKHFALSNGLECATAIEASERQALIQEILDKQASSYAIHHTAEFDAWRVQQNPHLHISEFHYRKNKRLVASLACNFEKASGVAYFTYAYLSPALETEDAMRILRHTANEMKGQGAIALRNWHFNHTPQHQQEKLLFKSAGFYPLERGIPFLWKTVGFGGPKPQHFLLSRLATEGLT